MSGRWRTSQTVTLSAFLMTGVTACSPTDEKSDNAVAETVVLFEDVAESTGLVFTHDANTTPEYFFPEINGAGGALLDYDNDGDLDVYLIQGGALDGSGTKTNRLFRNALVPSGELRFDDVTQGSGTGDNGYGMGVATGDYDNDGDVDIYLANFGANVLLRNDGDRFTDVTAASGTGDVRCSAGASFADYDHDGDLDLYVANYIDWSKDDNTACENTAGERDYCAPSNYESVSDALFRNDGDGVFTDVSEDSGIASVAGNGLGVVSADFNGDGLSDFYVANDQQANHLWLNAGEGHFEEAGLVSGSAYNAAGVAEASMGVTAGDYDGDGDDDLFMTHLNAESNTLYANDGQAFFDEVTDSANLAASSMRFTGFGSAWFDYDNDGFLDLFVANGAVMVLAERRGQSAFPYEQQNQLYRNLGNGRFADMSGTAGDALALREVSRGAAIGDVDNDGAIDVLVTNNSGPVRLLRNVIGGEQEWLRLRLVGKQSSRDAQGAKVALRFDDGTVRWGRAHSDGSYASASDVRVHFGLGLSATVSAVMVVWPRGGAEMWTDVAASTTTTLEQGSGEMAEPAQFNVRH
ncbi:MAG: CRTAC1 family protein [Pseudomonadota bacterium]